MNNESLKITVTKPGYGDPLVFFLTREYTGCPTSITIEQLNFILLSERIPPIFGFSDCTELLVTKQGKNFIDLKLQVPIVVLKFIM